VGTSHAGRRPQVRNDRRARLPKSVGGPRQDVQLVELPGDPDHPFAFSPLRLTVHAGTAVRWIDDADVFHTVTSTDSLEVRRPNGLFDHALFRRGDDFEYTFTRPGVYHYYCRPHAEFMTGTVEVVE
jgi:plastocyanin